MEWGFREVQERVSEVEWGFGEVRVMVNKGLWGVSCHGGDSEGIGVGVS